MRLRCHGRDYSRGDAELKRFFAAEGGRDFVALIMLIGRLQESAAQLSRCKHRCRSPRFWRSQKRLAQPEAIIFDDQRWAGAPGLRGKCRRGGSSVRAALFLRAFGQNTRFPGAGRAGAVGIENRPLAVAFAIQETALVDIAVYIGFDAVPVLAPSSQSPS